MKTSAILLLASALIFFEGCAARKVDYPDTIRIDGDRFHVQGIAFDRDKGVIYSSFTSSFLVSDLDGNLIGSITGINGHLGAITFDPETRTIYASLEFKDDIIGKTISKGLGQDEIRKSESGFYIAEIDADAVTSPDTPMEKAVTLHPVTEALKDYKDSVEAGDKTLAHRYGCSGIDGVTLAPGFGKGGRQKKHLYVAYGIYGDTTRTDNDYNILLCYDPDNLAAPEHKYFIHTGNTTFGVQNLAYDSFTDRIYLATYEGKKSRYPNYTMFAVDMHQEPFYAPLEGVPYETDEVEQLSTCAGWHFKWGSTGLNPLGDGYHYISEDGKENGKHYCKATLYITSQNDEYPFERYYGN